ncbi:MAG: hypothetical protein QXJ06_02685 [Candidatus Aenigmatarchaeota archaeon]
MKPCIFSGTAQDANCYVNGDKEYQNYVRDEICPDKTKMPHVMRTCSIEQN